MREIVLTLLISQLLADGSVDMVIPSGCRADNFLLGEHVKDIFQAEVDNDHALIFTLESIKANAPWIRRIYVLQDPQCEAVWKAKIKRDIVPEPQKTTWIDQCSLFPHPSRAKDMKKRFRQEKTALQQLDETFPELGIYHQGHQTSLVEQTMPRSKQRSKMRRQTRQTRQTLQTLQTVSEGPGCPTRNVYAVQTVLHHIPGLAPRFLYANPGDLALKSTAIETFFYGMKPRYPAGRGYDLYQNQSIAERLGQVGAAIPRSLGQRDRRVWVPLTKRVAQRIEQRYPIWLSFVRSHRRGKYSSKVNSCGTPESEKENSKEESLQGVWWWYLTSHPHSGIRHHGKLFEERPLSDSDGWEQLLDDPDATVVTMASSGGTMGRTVAERRQLRHKLKGLITLEISSHGVPGESDVQDEEEEAAEEIMNDPEQQDAVTAIGRYLRSES
mmetsp:Transcript_52016/g.113331  ORF Transcript_52016/g.113331 Transcript_52016/m.113331 type:complete len:441 (-) Transcript_52016:26-1348(-)